VSLATRGDRLSGMPTVPREQCLGIAAIRLDRRQTWLCPKPEDSIISSSLYSCATPSFLANSQSLKANSFSCRNCATACAMKRGQRSGARGQRCVRPLTNAFACTHAISHSANCSLIIEALNRQLLAISQIVVRYRYAHSQRAGIHRPPATDPYPRTCPLRRNLSPCMFPEGS
jgi:hypothetical protein